MGAQHSFGLGRAGEDGGGGRQVGDATAWQLPAGVGGGGGGSGRPLGKEGVLVRKGRVGGGGERWVVGAAAAGRGWWRRRLGWWPVGKEAAGVVGKKMGGRS